MNRDTKDASRSRAKRPELITAFFFGGDVRKISLLLFKSHVAETYQPLELRADSLAKVRKRKRLDVHRVSARQHGSAF